MATAEEIGTWVGGEPAGSSVRVIREVSAIETATESTLVFATNPDTLALALASKAGLILADRSLNSSFASTQDDRLMWVKDARFAFAKAITLIKPPSTIGSVHPSSCIGKNVRIAASATVGPHVFIGDDVIVGEGCTLDARVTVYSGTQLGDRVHVQAGAVLGSAGFGYARDPDSAEYRLFPQQGRLVIEDDVDIGANTTVDRGALGETRIGRGSKLDNLVHVGHNVRIGRHVIVAAQTGISGSSVIEDHAVIAGQVGIAEHVTIGSGVILGAKCGVPTGKVIRGSGEVFWGIPARPIRDYLRDLAKLRRL